MVIIIKLFEFQFADDDRSSVTERAGSIYDPMRTSFSNTTTVLENLQSQIKLKEGLDYRIVLFFNYVFYLIFYPQEKHFNCNGNYHVEIMKGIN